LSDAAGEMVTYGICVVVVELEPFEFEGCGSGVINRGRGQSPRPLKTTFLVEV